MVIIEFFLTFCAFGPCSLVIIEFFLTFYVFGSCSLVIISFFLTFCEFGPCSSVITVFLLTFCEFGPCSLVISVLFNLLCVWILLVAHYPFLFCSATKLGLRAWKRGREVILSRQPDWLNVSVINRPFQPSLKSLTWGVGTVDRHRMQGDHLCRLGSDRWAARFNGQAFTAVPPRPLFPPLPPPLPPHHPWGTGWVTGYTA